MHGVSKTYVPQQPNLCLVCPGLYVSASPCLSLPHNHLSSMQLSGFGHAVVGSPGQPPPEVAEPQLVGAVGYLAPECLRHRAMSAASDVFAFGVVLLELITGWRAVDETRPKDQQRLLDRVRGRRGTAEVMAELQESSPSARHGPNSTTCTPACTNAFCPLLLE